MSTTPGWTRAATALTSMFGVLAEGDGRKGWGLNRPLRPGPVAGFGAGAADSVGLEKWMSSRWTAAQAAVTSDTTRAATRAAVSRLEPVRTGAGGGGGGGAGKSVAGTSHGDGTLHSGGSVPAPVAPSWSSSIPSMIPGCRVRL